MGNIFNRGVGSARQPRVTRDRLCLTELGARATPRRHGKHGRLRRRVIDVRFGARTFVRGYTNVHGLDKYPERCTHDQHWALS